MANRIDGLFNNLKIDALYLGDGTTGGSKLLGLKAVTAAVDPASINAATKAGTAVTLTGVAAGDIVIAIPPSDLEDDLVPAGCVVTSANTATLYLYNASASPVDGASKTWTFLILDLTPAT